MSHSKSTKGSGPKRSIIDINPVKAWAMLAKMEDEMPGGMTGSPLLRPRLSEEEHHELNQLTEPPLVVKATRTKVRELVAGGRSGAEIVEELGIALPAVSAMRKKPSANRVKAPLVKASD